MKLCNKKLLTIGILVLCIASLGFVGAVSAGELSLSIDPKSPVIGTNGVDVKFTISPYNENSNYNTSAKYSDGNPFTLTIGKPNMNPFTQTFTEANTYIITVNEVDNEGTIVNTGSVEVVVNNPVTEIKSVALTLTEPKAGDKKITTATATSSTATSADADTIDRPTVSWSSDSTKDEFEAGKKYDATITVEAKGNYQFTDSTKVTLNGKTEIPDKSSDNKKIIIKKSYNLPATEDGSSKPVINSFTPNTTEGNKPLTVKFTYDIGNMNSGTVSLFQQQGNAPGTSDTQLKTLQYDSQIKYFTYTFESGGTFNVYLNVKNEKGNETISNVETIKVTTVAEPTNITSIDLKLTPPAIDGTPATKNQVTCTGGVQCDIIEWSTDGNFKSVLPSDATFEADKTYYARVTLSNTSNYKFTSSIPSTITVNGNKYASSNVNAEFKNQKLVVYLKCFDKTSAEISSVSATVTAPFSGETPDTEAVSGNEKLYSVYSTAWYAEGSSTPMKSLDTFEANTAYSVNITLKAVDTKKIFDTSLNTSDATINGNHVSYLKRNSDTEIVISYVFPKTAKLAGPEITFSISPTSPKIPSNANTVTVTYSYTITGNPTEATLFFGDIGSSEIDLGTATNGVITGTKTHEFNSIGSFTAYVSARNANGPSSKDITFSVGQDVLAAIIEAGPLSGTAPLSVTCNDKSSGTIMTRTWNFGDGSVASHETSTSHTYTSPGTYTITLTVSDGRDTSTATKVITVTEAKKQETTTPEKEPKEPVDYEPFFTIGDVEVPSPIDLIAEFVRLFQSMFDFDNYHIFSNETTEDE